MSRCVIRDLLLYQQQVRRFVADIAEGRSGGGKPRSDYDVLAFQNAATVVDVDRQPDVFVGPATTIHASGMSTFHSVISLAQSGRRADR
jgi:hypothetical protein